VSPALAAGDTLAAARALLVALGIGLLIGLERERQKGEGPSRGSAGIRTFGLAALLGALSSLLPHPAAFAIAAVFLAAITALGYQRTRTVDPGITSEVALFVTFLLGALAVGQPLLASALAVIVASLLAARGALHRFVRQILTEAEVHDGLVFAAAALVILPLLPNRSLGPFGALNPQVLWRLVVLVLAIGGIGHVALRTVGTRYGLPIAGFAAGFVSSTATIGTMGARARREPELCNAALAGALLSTVATVLQLVVVLWATSPAVVRLLAGPLALAGAVALLFGSLAARRNSRGEGTPPADAGRAFDLRAALVFALTVSAILILSAGMSAWLGTRGLFLAAAFAGFADTHAAAISAASLVASGHVPPGVAILPILAGLTTNTVSKIVVAWTTGGAKFGLRITPGLVLVALAAWVGWAIFLR